MYGTGGLGLAEHSSHLSCQKNLEQRQAGHDIKASTYCVCTQKQ